MKIGEGRRATTARATRRAIGSEEQQTEQALAIMIGRGREASTMSLLDLLRRSRFAGLLARLDLATWGPWAVGQFGLPHRRAWVWPRWARIKKK